MPKSRNMENLLSSDNVETPEYHGYDDDEVPLKST